MGLSEKLMAQGGKPSGLPGKVIGYLMNRSHRGVYPWGLNGLPLHDLAAALDIGCGGGEAVNYLAARMPEGSVSGIDHSPEMVMLARRVNRPYIEARRVTIDHGAVSSLPYGGNTFDLATAFETIQFWPNLDGDLREIRRVLKPDGTLLIVNRFPDLQGKDADWADRLQIRSAAEYRERLHTAGFIGISIDDRSKSGWIRASAKKPAGAETASG